MPLLDGKIRGETTREKINEYHQPNSWIGDNYCFGVFGTILYYLVK